MKRRILLVDDEIAVLLTLKAVLEISGFDVDTATSGLDGRQKLRSKVYDMVITDMRMEHEEAGRDVVGFARSLPNAPAIALLTAFPVADDDWQEMGADQMLVKPMHTRILLEQIETLFQKHQSRTGATESTQKKEAKNVVKKAAVTKSVKKAVKAVKSVAAKPVVAKVEKKAAKPAAKTVSKTVKPAAKPVAKKAVAKKAAVKPVKAVKAVKATKPAKAAKAAKPAVKAVKKTAPKKAATKIVKKAAKK
ncbi:response regulator [Terriglobus tenax]|uniref:response regulator n=1 Tax=Terriglobus tenax TaxID=1111115 RepID=UPI0021E02971|nr:response regulator [Terriglobus tenax]